jgi:hypothetical protein
MLIWNSTTFSPAQRFRTSSCLPGAALNGDPPFPGATTSFSSSTETRAELRLADLRM